MLKVVTQVRPAFNGAGHAGHLSDGRLSAMHDRLKSLLELARAQMSSRRKA